MEIVIKPKKAIYIDWKELWENKDLLFFLASKDISLRYRYPLVGVLWSIIKPLFSAFVLTFLFGKIFYGADQIYVYFLDIFLGLIFWNYFLTSFNKVSNSLISNYSMITKVYFPRLILPLSSLLLGLVDFFFSLLFFIVIVVLSGFGISPWLFFVLLLSVILTALTALGLGLLFASLLIKYRDIKELLATFTSLFFFVTPVIYRVKFISSAHNFLYINPLAGAIEMSRQAFYLGSFSSFGLISIFISLISVFLLLSVGIYAFLKIEQDLADIL